MRAGLLALIILIVLLALGISAYFFFHSPSGDPLKKQEGNELRKVDFIAENLAERLSRIEANRDFKTDYSFTLFDNGTVSFHVHAMHAGQFCPLHLHEDSEEVDFIIQGKGKVRSVLADPVKQSGRREIREMLLENNSLFFAPPGSAHEFINMSDEALACLVIQTPPFKGNLYAKEENLEKSAEASIQILTERADKMAGAGSGEAAVAVIKTLHNVESRLVRTAAPLTETMARGYDLIIIYFGGEALIEILDKRIKLTPTYFLGIPAGTPFRIIPSQGSQDSYLLCFYLPPVS